MAAVQLPSIEFSTASQPNYLLAGYFVFIVRVCHSSLQFHAGRRHMGWSCNFTDEARFTLPLINKYG
jgi:hypothetical protein